MKKKLLITSLLAAIPMVKAELDAESQAMIAKVNQKSASADKRVKNLKELRELVKHKPVVLAVKSTSCSACDIVDDAFMELGSELNGEVVRAEALIEFARDIKNEHNITTVPTVLFFQAGSDKPVHVMRGANKTEIKRHAHKLTGKGIPAQVKEAMEKAAQVEREAELLEQKVEKSTGSLERRLEKEFEDTKSKKSSRRKSTQKETKRSKRSSSKSTKAVSGKVTEISSLNDVKDALKSKKTVVLRVHSNGCPACQHSKKPTEDLASELGSSAVVIAAETHAAPEVAQHYHVSAVPTFVVLKGSLEPKETVVGADMNKLREVAKKHSK